MSHAHDGQLAWAYQPTLLYAGSGDSVGGSDGDGMYKSTDAGNRWTHIGLEDTTRINKVVVDPKDPNIVLASTTGDATRHGGGVYRTTDGGRTWQNVLKPEGFSGTRDLEFEFDIDNGSPAARCGLSAGQPLCTFVISVSLC